MGNFDIDIFEVMYPRTLHDYFIIQFSTIIIVPLPMRHRPYRVYR